MHFYMFYNTSNCFSKLFRLFLSASVLILDERVENTISSLTYMDVPRMAIFKKVDQVAITVATKQIYNINSRTLRNLASKFVPIEGLDMISKGLTVMHYSPNKNPDIKDKKQNVSFPSQSYDTD